jgi:aspartate racemase
MTAERILGIVGGIGPESTLDYYRRLVDGWHERVGLGSHPRVIIDSVDSVSLLGPMMAGDVEPIRMAITTATDRLTAAGAGLGIIASVASHVVFREVASAAAIPMLSIVDATCREAIRSGVRRPAVFGTRVAVDGPYFAEPFEAAGIELVRPAEGDRQWIHDVYLGELVLGVFREATRDRLLAILRCMRRDEAVDGLILAGTELSVILPQTSYEDLPVLNAAAIHVDAAIDWLAGGSASPSFAPRIP